MLTSTVCAALSAAGLAVAFLTAYRRRFVAATRIAAVALLPVGLAMAGLVQLGGKVGRAVGSWATDLVLKPTVWAGFGVLAVSVVLYVIARFAEGRAGRRSGGGKRKGRKERKAAAGSGGGAGGPAPGTVPALGPGSGGTRRKGGRGGDERGRESSDDFSEIEEILRKHGI